MAHNLFYDVKKYFCCCCAIYFILMFDLYIFSWKTIKFLFILECAYFFLVLQCPVLSCFNHLLSGWLKTFLFFSDSCSHIRAYELYTEAVRNGHGFVSTKCTDYAMYTLRLCILLPKVTIGGKLTLRNSGRYYLETNADEPYSKE